MNTEHVQVFTDQILPVMAGYLLAKFGLNVSTATIRKAISWATFRVLGGGKRR